jgi:hypothetical protein
MKWKSHAGQFLREIAVVVLGVLIALFINNWNEKNKQDRIVAKTLYAIGNEIEYSREEVGETMERHLVTIDTFSARLDNEEGSIGDLFELLSGFQIPEIKNIGLKYFIANNADLVEYELIADLSQLEFASKGFDLKLNQLMDFCYGAIDSQSKKDKERVV